MSFNGTLTRPVGYLLVFYDLTPLHYNWGIPLFSFHVPDLSFSTPMCIHTHALQVVTDFSSAPSSPPRTPLYILELAGPLASARAYSIRPAVKDNDQVLCSPNRRSSSCSRRSSRVFCVFSLFHTHTLLLWFLSVPSSFLSLFIILYFFSRSFVRATLRACCAVLVCCIRYIHQVVDVRRKESVFEIGSQRPPSTGPILRSPAILLLILSNDRRTPPLYAHLPLHNLLIHIMYTLHATRCHHTHTYKSI